MTTLKQSSGNKSNNKQKGTAKRYPSSHICQFVPAEYAIHKKVKYFDQHYLYWLSALSADNPTPYFQLPADECIPAP